jgi:hypothetical protein
MRKLNSNGTFPTFSSDGRHIYFERNRKMVYQINQDGSKERKLFPYAGSGFEGYRVVKPRFSADGNKLAFITDRPRKWHVWSVDLGRKRETPIAEGCEPVYYQNDAGKIAWISTAGALERTGIYLYDMNKKIQKPLIDADAPWGHEYFPTLADGDRFILYSACPPGEHDHHRANYQLFIKDLKTQTHVRITHDAYTNRWPKQLRSLP